MPCVHPMQAWRTEGKITSAGEYLAGALTFDHRKKDGRTMYIPCGTCIGCTKSKAQGWALRCLLELQQHECGTMTTLTYNPKNEPITLIKRHLQLFHKRLRRRKAARSIRHFSSGEYGEENGRPHYHTILFGAHEKLDRDRIQDAWGLGHAHTVAVTPSAIGYVAGYCAKKYNAAKGTNHERLDETTGELYEHQAEFIQMSRGGKNGQGIGGKARQYTNSWKDYAVMNGTRMPVPTYLHNAWKKIATEGEKEEHEYEKYLRSLTKERITEKHLEAQEQIEITKQRLQAQKRKL